MLNERIEEFDKEKEELRSQMAKEFKDTEKKLKEKMKTFIDQKQAELEKVSREMNIAQTQLHKAKAQNQVLITKYNQLQMEINNSHQNQEDGQFQNAHQTSHSPNSHSSTQSGKKIQKGTKVAQAGQNGKSPYLNDVFHKFQIGNNQNTSHGSVTSGVDSSKSTHSKMSN